MVRHSSATLREAKSTLRNKQSRNLRSTSKSNLIDANLKRRARRLITDTSIPGQTRSLIRYALEIKDRHLAQLVRRVEQGEMAIDRLHPE